MLPFGALWGVFVGRGAATARRSRVNVSVEAITGLRAADIAVLGSNR
jgi:hypothetical protein